VSYWNVLLRVLLPINFSKIFVERKQFLIHRHLPIRFLFFLLLVLLGELFPKGYGVILTPTGKTAHYMGPEPVLSLVIEFP